MKSTQNKLYELNESGEFIINDYNSAKLFSSFFPGVAGKNGIPMWVFYVNRGQCICSMGVEGKHNPIMEFLPANWAYNLVSTQGFRTFVKLPDHPDIKFYEPFQTNFRDAAMQRSQEMIITSSQLTLEEINKTLGLKFTVEYFNVPQENYAGLVRKLTIENLNDKPVKMEVLDGLPLIIPYGLDNGGLKFMRRLVEAFVEVTNYENGVPFFKGKVEPADRPDVVRIKKGNFYLGFDSDSNLMKTLVDPIKVFGTRGDYNYPQNFINNKGEDLTNGQIFENRLPCAMGMFETSLAGKSTYQYTSIIGHAGSVEELNALVPKISRIDYINAKEDENCETVDTLTQNNFICSAETVFDSYARQNFLDNALRGGFPFTLKGKDASTTLHLYSRKHGDLERDYNDYRLNPTQYSQGNGNYRDVNQNRRSDLYFNPDVKDGNVEHFSNLIQLDGFNPLVIKEIRFTIKDILKRDEILAKFCGLEPLDKIVEYLQKPFTPGELLNFLKEEKIAVKGDTDLFIADLLGNCTKNHDTAYGEGYWSDHWHYNLDLLENYLAVYPEQLKYIMFDKKDFTFYDNPHCVQPRDDKYVLWENKAMQLNAVVFDEEKDQLINSREHDPNKVRTAFGMGDVYTTNLMNKMLSLITNKLASLDSEGVGVEMESDKPNWYDALNGLPGLVGSSISETLEVKRHILFMLNAIKECGKEDKTWSLYKELGEFISKLKYLLKSELSTFEFWDKATSVKEAYRAETRLGISGDEVEVDAKDIIAYLEAGLAKLEIGVKKAWNQHNGLISTYFVNEVVDYEIIMIEDENGNKTEKRNAKGLPCFRAQKFLHRPLPLFLEGPVHYLRSNRDQAHAREFARNIRKSGLYDQKLKMYKVNASLNEEPMEIGRARTFSPGWFENESIWMHMEYKYMLELLRNKLFREFYHDFKNVLVPFMDPNVYGRSILENSSFIVSSGNPDSSIHGNGFVARLSGATAEFINILSFMNVGQKPFAENETGELELIFEPALPNWLFTTEPRCSELYLDGVKQQIQVEAESYSFMFLGEILVTYHNPGRKDTFGEDAAVPVSWKIIGKDDSIHEFQGRKLQGEIVRKIRNREVNRIDIELR